MAYLDKVHEVGDKAVGYVVAFGWGFVVAMLAFGN